MQQKTYTVMLVGGPHQEVQRRTIKRSSLVIAGSAAIGTLVLLAGFSMHYGSLSRDVFTTAAVRAENIVLRNRLHSLQDQVQSVESRMQTLDGHDAQLRTMTHVAASQPELAIGPVRRPTGARGGASDIDAFAVPPTGELGDALAFKDEMVDGQIAGVSRAIDRQASSVESLIAYYGQRATLLASMPSVWPTKGWITSTFGFRGDPFTGGRVMHSGIDLAAPDGTQVLAPAGGTVIFAGDRGGYGNFIALDHGRGIVTQFGHLSRVLVKVGDKIDRGHHIGAVGNTGRSTGPHLHYEVRQNGVPVNPRIYVLE